MKLYDLRTGWRMLVQEPAHTLAGLLGLSLGLAACMLLLGYARYSWQYNAHIPEVDRLYVVAQRYNLDPARPSYDAAPLFLRAAALKLPGVADATSYVPSRPEQRPLAVRIAGRLHELRGLVVLPGFDTTLGLEARHGDLRAALERPENIAITEQAALRLFGRTDAVGRTMQAEGKVMRVGAVLRQPPANSTIPFELLLGVHSQLTDPQIRGEMLAGEQGWTGRLLVKLRPGASLADIAAGLQRAVDAAPSVQNIAPEARVLLAGRKVMDIELRPLRDAYFDHQLASHGPVLPGQRADPAVPAALALVAVLILALAAVNYVNLATVRVLRRQREVAMRKVLGAGAGRIALQFVAESLLLSLLATGLGLLLAWLVLPPFAQLMNRDLSGLVSWPGVGAALALGVALGLLTALSPVLVALRVHPSRVLAGRPDTESRFSARLRRVLTVLQVGAAMGLAGVTLAIAWQTDYAMRASPGFDAAPLLVVDLPEPVRFSGQARALLAALKAQPGVQGVAVSEDAVGRQDGGWSRELTRPGGTPVSMDMKSVSANFFQLYRIGPLDGRLFDAAIDKEDDEIPVVLNALAARQLGWSAPRQAVGQAVLFTGFDGKVIHKRIVGIAPELRFRSLREAPRATAYELWTAGATLTVRASVPLEQAEETVRQLWPRYFPDAILKTHRASAILAANYADDARLARLLAIASAIALLIAAGGTYVLSAHSVQRRAREIVLRKLHGAGRTAVGLLVVREAGMLLLLAALAGLPVAAVAIQRYLGAYVERAPIGGWTLLLAAALTTAVSAAAIARQAWIAMRMQPARALRG